MSLIYPCIHYDGGQCKKFSYPGVYSVCSCEECEYQESSNADRIRAMDDEELAEFLAYTWATSARAWQKRLCRDIILASTVCGRRTDE